MPSHKLILEIPPKMLFHKDAEIRVQSGDTTLVTLKFSKGSIEWKPAGYIYGFHMKSF